MMSFNHLFHSNVQWPYSTFFFLRSIAAFIFVDIHVLLELKVGRFLQMHVYLITVLFGMYPVWIPRWIQITSIQTLFKIWFCLRPHDANKCLHKPHLNSLDNEVLCHHSPICVQLCCFLLHLTSKNPACILPCIETTVMHCTLKKWTLALQQGDLRLSLAATHWASVRFLALCCLFRTFFSLSSGNNNVKSAASHHTRKRSWGIFASILSKINALAFAMKLQWEKDAQLHTPGSVEEAWLLRVGVKCALD